MLTTRSKCHGGSKKGKTEAYMMKDGRKELKKIDLEYYKVRMEFLY
jgi:hypothetical protein